MYEHPEDKQILMMLVGIPYMYNDYIDEIANFLF